MQRARLFIGFIISCVIGFVNSENFENSWNTINESAQCVTQKLVTNVGGIITDFKWKLDSCPSSVWATYEYPDNSQSGAPPPLNFDSIGTSGSRVASFRNTSINVPFTVDVSKLRSFDGVCLTVADCRIPPILSVVRNYDTKTIWDPSKYPSKFVPKKMYKNVSSANLVKFIPPIPDRYITSPIKNLKTTYFNNNKIARIDFELGTKKLYVFMDMTCKMYRRKGFFGQSQASVNGLFLEVLLKGSDPKIPSVHSAMRKDLGFTDSKEKYNDVTPNRRLQMYAKFKGQRNWYSMTQLWLTVNKVTTPQMVAGHLQSALAWSLLSPPKGNWPISVLYMLAAQNSYTKMKTKTKVKNPNVDFSILTTYTSEKYDTLKPSLDYLVSIDPIKGVPIFMSHVLDGSRCVSKLPSNFVNSFLRRDGPPESGCDGSELDCTRWCSVDCIDIMTILKNANKLVWNEIMGGVPKCSECPGLIGNFGESLTVENPLFSETKYFPQCLPFKSNGVVYYDNGSSYKELDDKYIKENMSMCKTCTNAKGCVSTDPVQVL